MTPMPGFVKDLRSYDPNLRVRWGEHTRMWIIEHKLRPRNPQWVSERPAPWGSPRGLDLWEGWKDGYVHVLSVHPDLLAWSVVAPELARCDAERAGGFEALNQELDAAEAAWEAEVTRERKTWLEGASREFHDQLAWKEGRRVAVPVEVAEVVKGDGTS